MTTISRRSFLGAIIAAAAAPAIVRSASLMPIVSPKIWLPPAAPLLSPLNFGNMGWSPELTIVLNRAGYYKAVGQPIFRHVTNLPILNPVRFNNYEV